MIDTREKVLLGSTICSQKKASDIVVLDMRGVASFTDYFLICSGESDTQIRAIVDAIIGEMKKRKVKVWHVEGYEDAKWVLLDYGDIVIHIFHPEIRQFYQIEKLWADAPLLPLPGTDNCRPPGDGGEGKAGCRSTGVHGNEN